jgi:hypothetical protein
LGQASLVQRTQMSVDASPQMLQMKVMVSGVLISLLMVL